MICSNYFLPVEQKFKQPRAKSFPPNALSELKRSKAKVTEICFRKKHNISFRPSLTSKLKVMRLKSELAQAFRAPTENETSLSINQEMMAEKVAATTLTEMI